MRERKTLKEGAVDLEYHYTPLSNLISMMETNEFHLKESDVPMELGRGGRYFMSLTRMRSSQNGGYGGNMISNGDRSMAVARIELDGRKLSNVRNGKVKQFDYYSDEYHKKKLKALGQMSESTYDQGFEAEDSLTLNNTDVIKNAVSYIKRIDVFLPKTIWETDLKSFCKFVKTKPDWYSKMHFYTEVKDFDWQTKNEISLDDIIKLYTYNERNRMNIRTEQKIRISEGELRKIIHEAINTALKGMANNRSSDNIF